VFTLYKSVYYLFPSRGNGDLLAD